MLHSIKAKIYGLREFYTFQKLGYPSVKMEKISKSLLKKYLPPNPVSIDCGAHDGSDSAELIKILKGTLHAFEPVPDIYRRLCDNTAGYKSIKTYQLALSNETGSSSFFVSEGGSDASSSLLSPKDHLTDHVDTFFNKKIEVATITLDDWAKKYQITGVDLLWLDMQGFEMSMLKASKQILPTVKVIHSEVSTKETYEGVAQYEEYRKFLESVGFKVIVEAIPAGWDMGNVLFVRS